MSGFWAKRREAVAAEALAEDRAAEEARAEAQQAELDALSDEEILARYDLPDPDMLDDSDAVKDFMKHALPERLRRRALRRLWRLNPVLANVDGLVDYGEDFTDAATVIEGLQTAYQVGKGMMAHVEELARQAEEAQAPPETDAPEEIDDPDTTELALAETAQVTPPPDPWEPSAQDAAPPLSQSRRMTFDFETAT